MSNQENRWPNQGIPLGQPFNRQNPPVLPPPATLEAGGQQFNPFTSLPALGNRGNNTTGHVFTIPSINSNDDQRSPQGTRIPQVPGYGSLSSHLPNSIYNITNPSEKPTSHQSPQAQQPHQPQQEPQQAQTSQQSQQQEQSQNPQPHLPQPPQVLGGHQSNTQPQVQQSLQSPDKQALSMKQQTSQKEAVDVEMNADQQARRNSQGLPQGIINRSSTSNAYRPLNVKDALSYLDQVKLQFFTQADVYNNFLDIMKDFKSQSIDTPGVIDRVSTLFRGHPNLIQGFNTFLPPGYKIECSMDPSDPNPIRVTTPTGTTTRPNLNTTSQYAPAATQHWSDQAQAPVMAPYSQEQHSQAAGGQIEFNHAISYVNKIKTRFANQPDIYKQFLEILQTYQREQKPIGEVYEQVTHLFANSPDLLNDFKQFLPDSGNQKPSFLMRPEEQVMQNQQILHPQENQQFYSANGGSQLPPLGNFQPNASGAALTAEQNYHQYKSPPDFDQRTGGLVQEPFHKNSEHYAFETNYNEEANYSGIRGAPSVISTKQKSVTPGSSNQVLKVNPTLVPGIPEPVPPSSLAKASSLSEELSFFDKVKKAIGNKQTYNEFLKVLNLYSQDIINKETLVERVEAFLGDNYLDLLNWFKQFVGFEEKTQHMEDITFKKHQIELSLCKAYGPSYRQLPKVETFMPCSGRDEMCWEVLNDEWVGHPTWASEDSGFISHRKNQYEEILFKIEEERLEFDYHMEANLRTIQTLETIANRIANMTPEQKANFKLPTGLGHTSQTIYKKVIRKIYDKDRGFEVIDALHENPAVAVPVVLKRLKQKDEEWKRAQREWNKVWREMEQKVFYKSLDHLGLTFKQADKKLLTAKQLVSEISTVKVEQHNKRVHPLTPKPQEQLNYEFSDNEIIFDIIRLAEFYIHHSSNYSSGDRDKLAAFFKHFIALLFGISSNIIESALASRARKADPETPNDKEVENSNNSDANGTTSLNPSKKRGREQDLLRDVLKKQSKSRKEDLEDGPSSETDEYQSNLENDVSGDLWINPSSSEFSLDATARQEKRDKFNFFCNTTAYVFFRHFRTLYERLAEIKALNEMVGKEIGSRKTPQFAKDLNLISHQLQELGVEITAGPPDCYTQVLNLAERLLDGEIEHQWYEESLRQAYRNKAYKCYTLDKVVQSLVKHMHSLISDSRSSEMIVLFEQDRHSPTTSAKNQILYRMRVRSLMSTDENMFKITYHEPNNSINIQFVGLDDLTINDHANSEEMYNYYVTSYIMSHPTEGVPMSKISMPFQKEFLESVDEDQCNGSAISRLKVSICENSYRLFFEQGTHDKFTSNTLASKQKDLVSAKTDKLESLKNVVNDKDFGWRATMDVEQASKFTNNFEKLLSDGVEEFKAATNQIKESLESGAQDEEVIESTEVTNSVENQRINPDATIDADSTVAQDQNDTTIQQDHNDSTMEDASLRDSGKP